MSIDCQQLRGVVITPALISLGMFTPAAVNLLLGTCAQESAMGSYLIQKNIGLRGGLGIFQMETRTYLDIWDRLINKDIALRAKIRLKIGYDGMPPAERMCTDLLFAAMMCRLHYWLVKAPLPDANDIPAMAAYYKKYYNSPIGKATEQQFIDNYKRYVT